MSKTVLNLRKPAIYLLALLIGAAFMSSTLHSAQNKAPLLMPWHLRCEYRIDPPGIDVTQPRLSWLLKSADDSAHGQVQTAYQILVASSSDQLAAGNGDLWDSGKIQSNETSQIVYAGKALVSGQRCFWKVRSWNGSDQPSNWSEPAHWSMGLLSADDWKATWIGYDAPVKAAGEADVQAPSETLNFDGLSWIWSSENEPAAAPAGAKDAIPAPGHLPAGARYFRTVISIDNGEIERGHGLITADNRFEIFVNGKSAGYSGDFKRAQSVDFTRLLHAGPNVIAIWAQNDSAGPAGLIGRLRIKLKSQPSRIIDIDPSWQVSRRKIDQWNTAPELSDPSFKPAVAVAKHGDAPWGRIEARKLNLPPTPYLRHSFTVSKSVARATVYASALGIYELHLNGRRVGADHFTPGWTEYAKRVHYQTYDVTDMLQQGDNAIGAILADGWYAGYFGFTGNRELYGKDPRVIAQLQIEYADGSKQLVVTDESWKASYGPIREADLLMGCTFDAQMELRGWDASGFDDSKWDAVAVTPHVLPKLQAAVGDPVRSIEQIQAQSVAQPQPGMYVYDLGQNMVGWVRLKMSAPAGTRIVLRFAEMLNPDGTLYTASLRGARATDTYIAGGGEFVWEPSFTFHGFRYVEITGVDAPPTLDAVTGIVVHTQMQRSGHFESSSSLVNQLVHNIIWGQKGNYLEVPTDCPQRDERLGWTGDAQFFIPTAAYNFDVGAFFTKWLVDLVDDSQGKDGAFAAVAPDVLKNAHGATAWADAGIICPYTIYKVYEDRRVVEQHYANMARYIDYLKSTSKELIRGQGAFGDWVNLGGGAASEVIGTAYFEHVTRLMSEMAAAIGKSDDAERYRRLADDVRTAFRKAFVTSDGKIKDSSQTGYALAFTMDLLPDDAKVRSAAAANFVEEIKKKDWHLATGFIGTPRLLPALSLAKRHDVAYRLLLTETFPSWLFQVKLGATTMWERWDGWVPGRGFQDPGMNSFNHYAFGSVGEFLYRTVGGIDTDGPGYRKIIIRPQPDGGLTFSRCSYDSINGTIESSWRTEAGSVRLDVNIPVNTSATVYVPSSDPTRAREISGAPVTQAGTLEGAAIFQVGSGKYTFTAPLEQRH
jgi:alpha-L-rhamnosidase